MEKSLQKIGDLAIRTNTLKEKTCSGKMGKSLFI